MATVCNGRGDGGGHCCWINGEVCPLLFIDRGGTPRCSVWGEWESETWRGSPAGRMFAERWPGFNCSDWPQNLPGFPEGLGGLCCWSSDGDVG